MAAVLLTLQRCSKKLLVSQLSENSLLRFSHAAQKTVPVHFLIWYRIGSQLLTRHLSLKRTINDLDGSKIVHKLTFSENGLLEFPSNMKLSINKF